MTEEQKRRLTNSVKVLKKNKEIPKEELKSYANWLAKQWVPHENLIEARLFIDSLFNS